MRMEKKQLFVSQEMPLKWRFAGGPMTARF